MNNGNTTPPATHPYNYDNAPTYAYTARLNELHNIRQIFDLQVRAEALQTFIDDEKDILNLLNPPAPSSQALNNARCMLASIQHPAPFFPPLPGFHAHTPASNVVTPPSSPGPQG